MVSDMISMNNKIISRDKLIGIVKDTRKKKKKIVTTNGAFDLFHVGHLNTIEFSKNLGDILIVCLNSDNSIKRYKSKRRPIIPQEQRAEIVAAIEYVDYVIIFDEETPVELLSLIKPDFHVKGSEYKNNLLEKEVIERNGGKLFFIERDDISTTKIIEKILKSGG